MARSQQPPIRDTAIDLLLSDDEGSPSKRSMVPTQAEPLTQDEGPGPDGGGRTSLIDAPLVLAGRYELNGVLGGGAMGTVYRAKDRTLDEAVALKLLKRELATSPDLVERFRREVKLARRITHRNIARVFDIGAHATQPFLTMELIEGTSLADIVSRRAKLPPREVVTLAGQLCAGLSAAHAAGVIHRDLKPENIIIEENGERAVITDFGVACALTERDLPYGATGVFVGSPAYMSPEQVEGTSKIDARADVYALGVMLYELLTGQLPWEGGSVFAVAAARLVRDPPDPREADPEIPDPLATLVMRCMAREREGRLASADDIARELNRSSTPRAPQISIPPPTLQANRRAGGKSVAVMPLSNEVGAEVDYFCRGFAADLVDLLGAVPDVQARHAPIGPTAADSRENARVLGVKMLITGTLKKLSTTGALRLSLRLHTVEDGIALWSKRFDGVMPVDLGLAAREAAIEIGLVLASSLGSGGPAVPSSVAAVLLQPLAAPRSSRVPPIPSPKIAIAPPDPRADDLHMRGRHAYRRAWYGANEEAVRLLEEALALAPKDPRISSTLSLALARAYGSSNAGEAAATRARELAEQAITTSPGLSDARVALASLHAYDAEGVAAAGELKRALAAAPDSIEALDWMGRLLVEVGDVERGLAYLDRAVALEPTMFVTRLTAMLARALIGDWARVDEDLEIKPSDSADGLMYAIYSARIAMWRKSTLASHEIPNASDEVRTAIAFLFAIVSTRTINVSARSAIAMMLPTESAAGIPAPRRAVFNAQLRAELFLHAGMTEDAVAAIRDADANGMFDIVWLEQCPLLEPLKPQLGTIQKNVAARASRTRAALLKS